MALSSLVFCIAMHRVSTALIAELRQLRVEKTEGCSAPPRIHETAMGVPMCNDSQLDPNFLETFFELFYEKGVALNH